MRYKDFDCMIIGTGPSIDNIDWSEMPATRIAVHLAAYVAPDVQYVAGLDKILFKEHMAIFKDKIAIINKTTEIFPENHGITLPEKYVVVDQIYSGLCAVRFAIETRFKSILFAGWDGGRSLSKHNALDCCREKYSAIDKTGRPSNKDFQYTAAKKMMEENKILHHFIGRDTPIASI